MRLSILAVEDITRMTVLHSSLPRKINAIPGPHSLGFAEPADRKGRHAWRRLLSRHFVRLDAGPACPHDGTRRVPSRGQPGSSSDDEASTLTYLDSDDSSFLAPAAAHA